MNGGEGLRMEKMWFSWAVKMGKMGKMGEVSFCFLSFPLGLDFSRILVVVVVILFGIFSCHLTAL